MLRIRFLGTNGWYDTAAGNTVSVLVDAGEFALVLDAGYGLAKLDEYVDPDRPVFIFLSHLHLDHVAGLHVLNKFRYGRGMELFVPEGELPALKTLLGPPYTKAWTDLPYPVTLHELPRDLGRLPCRATVHPMRHSTRTLGIRLEIEGKIIAYCPDTGVCPGAVEAARDADVLIAECAFRPGEESEAWPHLNPATAAGLAREAGARRLFLTHFDASRYPHERDREAAEEAARAIFQATMAAGDGLTVMV